MSPSSRPSATIWVSDTTPCWRAGEARDISPTDRPWALFLAAMNHLKGAQRSKRAASGRHGSTPLRDKTVTD